MLKVPEGKKIRVLIDTDAACEADDPFAIVHALLTPKFDVRGILAEQFGTERNAYSTQESYDEIQVILQAMGISHVPVYMGAGAAMKSPDDWEDNEASRFLVEEAMRDCERPLFVLCQGALTNVAIAIRMNPAICSRMTVLWIGGFPYDKTSFDMPATVREFNAGNDVLAANTVLFSGVRLWQIPMNVYTTMRVSLAELVDKVGSCGSIGRHLVDQMIAYNNTTWAFWTQGENWSLGDSPVVGLAMQPRCGTYVDQPAQAIGPDTRYLSDQTGPVIRVYTSIDSRFILEDMFAKLRLFATLENQNE